MHHKSYGLGLIAIVEVHKHLVSIPVHINMFLRRCMYYILCAMFASKF